MAGQEQQQFSHDEHEDETPAPEAQPQATQSDVEVDALLDEIDDVLEVNAETFVRGFVQKGGQ
ncbi:ubiquitin-like protein Pup [Timonella sp. A28]|uniref:ubiquitin-like protein Pup n=1 Tax=Timonella sp. A28 TaxID=3442640 RepID=UPI003EBCBEFD